MSLAELLMERFKVKTRAVENPKITSLGVTAQQVLGNNPDRLAFIVQNLSANVIYLSLKNDVSSSKGIRLAANGGSFSCIWDEDFQMTGWAWWAVATGASSAVYAIEVLEY